MSDLRALALIPFVPGGKDFALSRRFFAELGFEELWENGGYAGFRSGDAEFLLQDLDHQELATNLMIQIVVPNLDQWWETVSRKRPREHLSGGTAPTADRFPVGTRGPPDRPRRGVLARPGAIVAERGRRRLLSAKIGHLGFVVNGVRRAGV